LASRAEGEVVCEEALRCSSTARAGTGSESGSAWLFAASGVILAESTESTPPPLPPQEASSAAAASVRSIDAELRLLKSVAMGDFLVYRRGRSDRGEIEWIKKRPDHERRIDCRTRVN
jgi:hypothetical protein